MKSEVVSKFVAMFGSEPEWVAFAPGRVNLIGEHTDYNDGFVLPVALTQGVWIVGRNRPDADSIVRVISHNFGGDEQFDLRDLVKGDVDWIEYIKGMAWALGERGYTLNGWEGVVAGNVPPGAGLSSSAALEMATARAFQAVSGFDWDGKIMPLVGQTTENEWMGANTGIMDQTISANGVADHALLIDCRDLTLTQVALPESARIVILDTGTRHRHVDSEYNTRRAQCEAVAAHFGVTHLRDLTLGQLEDAHHQLDEIAYRRARHVVTENARVLAAVSAFETNDLVAAGQRMNKSHISMRDDFEISSEALDAMVEIAQARGDCYGARMTGGGFAGCAVALVEADRAEEFAADVLDEYRQSFDESSAGWVCRPGQGATLEK